MGVALSDVSKSVATEYTFSSGIECESTDGDGGGSDIPEVGERGRSEALWLLEQCLRECGGGGGGCLGVDSLLMRMAGTGLGGTARASQLGGV